MKRHAAKAIDAEVIGDEVGLRVALGEFQSAAERQYKLRKRREAIIRELTRPKALTDEETLALTREMRSIQAELDGRADGAA
jgi:hypothetical protein